MGESSDENEPILLPWYPNVTNRGKQVDLGNQEGDDEEFVSINYAFPSEPPPILLPWHPAGTSRAHEFDEASTSAATPHSILISHFVGMGFPENVVIKAIEENGESNTELVLESLLTYSTLNDSPSECEPVPCDYDIFSDSDSCLENEDLENKDDAEHLLDKDEKLLHLIEMEFNIDEASAAIDACGHDTPLTELMDFIYAAQTAKCVDASLQDPYQPVSDDDEASPTTIKRRKTNIEPHKIWGKKVDTWRTREKTHKQKEKRASPHEDVTIRVPTYMIGFGVPNDPRPLFKRTIPEAAVGPPFFYYENVAYTPKGVWSTISRFLFEIEPEFVDSLHFCAAARKRGYIHNLPVHSRFPLLPIPPQTIQEALPETKRWWPSWDKRTKLNCLNTCFASAALTQRLRDSLERYDGVPPLETQKYVLYECRKWNLVWTGKNKLAPLEPDELEMLLGYQKDHTRGGGANRSDRYKSLGNSFQVDTVAYHFSVLKGLFPNGINVLSLFSGIGGAEVALHRLGVSLNNVVSVEINPVNRNIIRSWWEQTNQKGKLHELEDVQELTPDKLLQLIHTYGGFDLIVGGSPCNNLTGSNRHHRDGLQGEHSILFYDFFRIVNNVKTIMGDTN